MSDSWSEHVEAFVPRGVAGLFFFDGEQIESFADLHSSRELVQTAVGGLLGARAYVHTQYYVGVSDGSPATVTV